MFNQSIKGMELCFETDPSVFSPSAVDRGTLAMLSETEFMPGDKVLDLGCGYGVVGILAAKQIGPDRVVLCDISPEAVQLAKYNGGLNGANSLDVRLSDGLENIPERDFTLIMSNPPYHTDFSVAKHFIEDGFRRLCIGGRMVMVTKRLDWYRNKLTAVFGGVKVVQKDGYYIFTAEKRTAAASRKKKDAPALSKKLRRRYAKP